MKNAHEFVMWLKGFFEISGSTTLSPSQVQLIRQNLEGLFEKKTPERGGSNFPFHYNVTSDLSRLTPDAQQPPTTVNVTPDPFRLTTC